jgi:2-polyprenyl-3-methyl-5-hydroxy-6-metoxy-1,4-benzoquinol methylase
MTSNPNTIPIVVSYLKAHPELKSVLDIGVGYGKYGFLIREYLETHHGRFKKGEFKIRVDGVEPFQEMLTFQYQIYDNIYLKPIQQLEVQKGQYDLILWIDILEHMEPEEAVATFNRLKSAGREHLIATPKTFQRQNIIVNTEYDQHRSLIKPFMLDKTFKRLDTNNNSNYIYVIQGE